MKRRHQFFKNGGVILAVAWAFSGCAARPLFVIRHQEEAAHVKKVAVMPFLDAQFQSAYDPYYKGLGSSFVPALMFDEMAKKTLSSRFEILGQDQSVEALKKQGVQYRHIEGAWSAVRDPESIRWGYTLAQALKAGKEMKADAILMCVQGQYFKDKKKPVQAIGLRLVDVNTGKTLWGVNATGQPGLFSKGKVVRELLARVAKEAP